HGGSERSHRWSDGRVSDQISPEQDHHADLFRLRVLLRYPSGVHARLLVSDPGIQRRRQRGLYESVAGWHGMVRARRRIPGGHGSDTADGPRTAVYAPSRSVLVMHRVTLYTRAGCHLCDEAKKVLDAARGRVEFTLEILDIDADPELRRLYDVE